MITAADVLYDPALIPILIGLLSDLMKVESPGVRMGASPSPKALIVTTLRQEVTLMKFLDAARNAGKMVKFKELKSLLLGFFAG